VITIPLTTTRCAKYAHPSDMLVMLLLLQLRRGIIPVTPPRPLYSENGCSKKLLEREGLFRRNKHAPLRVVTL